MKIKENSRIDEFVLSLHEIWKFSKRLPFILISVIAINAVLPFPNVILSGVIVDTIIEGKNFFDIVFYVSLMLVINLILTVVNILLKKERDCLFIKFKNKLENDITDKCMNTDFEQFNDSYFQDRILLIKDMVQGENFFTNITTMFEIVSQIITLIGIIVIMTSLDIWLLFIMAIVIVLQSILHIKQLRYNIQFQYDVIKDQRKLSYVTQLAQSNETKKDIDIFNLYDFILNKIKSYQKNLLDITKSKIKISGFIEVTTYFLSIVFQLSAYIVIGYNAFTRKVTVGDFTMGIASLINFWSASSFVATNLLNLNNGLFYIRKYQSFLKLRSKFDEISDITINDIDLDNIEIEFRNVWFRYPNSTSYVLKNINITIKNKEKFAIVGYNGAGKTSFVLLLMRMYDPTEGSIHLNGIDIRKIDYRDYLKVFSTVNQDFSLFSFSILENIINADTNIVKQEEREAILELFNNNGMGARLKKLYKGLDTPITKTLFASGVDFSGGERQKIAIVRALYKNSPILILDEPTAALDPIAEYELYKNFSEMAEGKLTVYISHRIYSTRFCDKIAVFDKGELVEYGTYDELMEMKGLYYYFYQKQSEYF